MKKDGTISRLGAAYERGRSGSEYSAERVSETETSRDDRADDQMDGAEQNGNTLGDLQEVQGDRSR